MQCNPGGRRGRSASSSDRKRECDAEKLARQESEAIRPMSHYEGLGSVLLGCSLSLRPDSPRAARLEGKVCLPPAPHFQTRANHSRCHVLGIRPEGMDRAAEPVFCEEIRRGDIPCPSLGLALGNRSRARSAYLDDCRVVEVAARSPARDRHMQEPAFDLRPPSALLPWSQCRRYAPSEPRHLGRSPQSGERPGRPLKPTRLWTLGPLRIGHFGPSSPSSLAMASTARHLQRFHLGFGIRGSVEVGFVIFSGFFGCQRSVFDSG